MEVESLWEPRLSLEITFWELKQLTKMEKLLKKSSTWELSCPQQLALLDHPRAVVHSTETQEAKVWMETMEHLEMREIMGLLVPVELLLAVPVLPVQVPPVFHPHPNWIRSLQHILRSAMRQLPHILTTDTQRWTSPPATQYPQSTPPSSRFRTTKQSHRMTTEIK